MILHILETTLISRMFVADFTVTYADQFNEHKDKKLALKLVTSLKIHFANLD